MVNIVNEDVVMDIKSGIDRGSYEKLSIRDSARSLKKYGSTSTKTSTKNETYIKHFVSNTDTLQGVALKYNVTIEQIRRANKLWASDSLFLREYLLIPQSEGGGTVCEHPPSGSSSKSSTKDEADSGDDEDIGNFLSKIDASIANTKEGVKRVTSCSEFGTESPSDGPQKPQSRLKKQLQQNNNLSSTHNTVVTVKQEKVRTSLEQQQDEFFEL